VEPTTIDLDRLQARLDRPEYGAVRQSLREIGMTSVVDLFSTYAGRKEDLGPWLHGAAINRDRNLRLQYLAGLGLNRYESDAIYSEMLAYSRYPASLFTGSEAMQAAVREAIARAQQR
jgi:spermidine synthase